MRQMNISPPPGPWCTKLCERRNKPSQELETHGSTRQGTVSCVDMCNQLSLVCCAHTCAHLQVATHVFGSPPYAGWLIYAHLGSRCKGEGRVLAHTSKQHHELLLPAYLKIATAKKPGHAGPGGGMDGRCQGNGSEPLLILSLSLQLPPALEGWSLQGSLWGLPASTEPDTKERGING